MPEKVSKIEPKRDEGVELETQFIFRIPEVNMSEKFEI
jgi:hypothetical protein